MSLFSDDDDDMFIIYNNNNNTFGGSDDVFLSEKCCDDVPCAHLFTNIDFFDSFRTEMTAFGVEDEGDKKLTKGDGGGDYQPLRASTNTNDVEYDIVTPAASEYSTSVENVIMVPLFGCGGDSLDSLLPDDDMMISAPIATETPHSTAKKVTWVWLDTLLSSSSKFTSLAVFPLAVTLYELVRCSLVHGADPSNVYISHTELNTLAQNHQYLGDMMKDIRKWKSLFSRSKIRDTSLRCNILHVVRILLYSSLLFFTLLYSSLLWCVQVI